MYLNKKLKEYKKAVIIYIDYTRIKLFDFAVL